MIFSYRVAEEKAVEQFAVSYLKDEERHRAYMNMVQRDLCSIDEKRFLIYRWLEDCSGLYKEKKDQEDPGCVAGDAFEGLHLKGEKRRWTSTTMRSSSVQASEA